MRVRIADAGAGTSTGADAFTSTAASPCQPEPFPSSATQKWDMSVSVLWAITWPSHVQQSWRSHVVATVCSGPFPSAARPRHILV